MLEKGDYILSDQCAVERKTVNDFVYTLTRRYLFEQIFTLKRCLPKIARRAGRLHAHNLQVQQHSPSCRLGRHVQLSKKRHRHSQHILIQRNHRFPLHRRKQEQIVEKEAPVVHAFKKCETLSDSQVYFVASLPNVGREKATAILDSYQTPMNALINVDDWSKSVHGLVQ